MNGFEFEEMRLMKRRLYLLSLLFLPLLLPAQVYNVTGYSTADGLSQSQVRALMQDQKGFLWLGTHRGVNKFDGRNFTSYSAKSAIIGNFVTDLIQDQQGRIWIATDKGISRFDGRGFVNYTTEDSLPLPSPDVQALMEDSDGRIWVGVGGEICVIEEGRLIVKPYSWDQPHQQRIIYDLLEIPGGHVWIATDQGLFQWRGQRIEPYTIADLPSRPEIYKILVDKKGRLWLGTNRGVYLIDQQRVTHFTQQEGLSDNRVFCLVEDQQGWIWFGTGRGVSYFHDGKISRIVRTDRILDFQIRSAAIDSEGDLWFGTEGGGVRKLTRGVFEQYNMEDGLSSNIAKSFLKDESGRIWVSTYDQGINIIRDRTVLTAERKGIQTPGMGGKDISYSFEDSKGNFWFAFYTGGITRYDGKGFRTYGASAGLTAGASYCIAEDHTGQLWIGTDKGIYVLKNETFSHIGLEEGLRDETVFSLLEDSRQRVWIGTSKGLSRWEAGKIRHFDHAGDNVISFLEEKDEQRLWIASSVSLSLYDLATDSAFIPVRVSGAEGAEVAVSLALETPKGGRFLWIGTENGAYRLDLSTFDPTRENATFEHYTQKDGLPSMECNANAAFVDEEGNLWLGTAEGAIRKPADSERRDPEMEPRIHITEVRISSDSTWQDLGYQIDRNTSLPANLSLPYTENTLDFHYIGISLKSPQQIEYKHRLLGQDDRDWEEIKSTRQTNVSIANLIPGNYTFEVITKKESSQWDENNVARFSFTIQRPYWQTWWFRSIQLLILAGFGYAVYRTVTNRRRQRQREQMMKNQAEKLTLEHQALYAMMNPHFTFNALQSIQYYIHRQDKVSANKFLSSFARLIRKNLESTQSDFISLAEEVERLGLYLSLEKMRFHEKFEYQVSVDPEVDQHNTLLPPMILQPFVENSIKHGIMPLEGEGKVEVRISKRDEAHLQILISDNGIGVEASRKQKENRPNDHVSKGMQITQDRLKLFADMTHKQHSLDIEPILDEKGAIKGTQVRMVLPLYV